jgi:hypothetical protein
MVVVLFSGVMVTLTGLEGGLGANVASPLYRAVRLYDPPGKLFTWDEAEPLVSVKKVTL